jgi:hypothetical protein
MFVLHKAVLIHRHWNSLIIIACKVKIILWVNRTSFYKLWPKSFMQFDQAFQPFFQQPQLQQQLFQQQQQVQI